MEKYKTFINGEIICKLVTKHPKTSTLIWCDWLCNEDGTPDYFQPVNIYRTDKKQYIKKVKYQIMDDLYKSIVIILPTVAFWLGVIIGKNIKK